MSDAKTGEDSPPRPGKNANLNRVTDQSKGRGKKKRGSAGLRLNRNPQADTGIQAKETLPSSKGDDQTRPLDAKQSSKRSKRRRRRRGRGNKPIPGETQKAQPETGSPALPRHGFCETGHVPQAGSISPAAQSPNPASLGERGITTTAKGGSEQPGPSRNAGEDVTANTRENTTGGRPKRRRSRRPGAKIRNHDVPVPEPVPGAAKQVAGNEAAAVGRTERSAGRQGTNPAHRSRDVVDAYAALDLGTNNCRLLVAVPQQPGRFRVVDAFSRIVRLGEGLAASGALKQEAMDRAVGALKVCAGKLENRQVRGVRLIATEACRRAVNGAEFLERVEREAGLKLEIIDRETEARLAVAGCASLIDREAKGVVLFDIGGGSSELALLDLRNRQGFDVAGTMRSWTSLPLGVVTLSENHGGGKHVTRDVFNAMVAEVAGHLANFQGRNVLEEASRDGEIHLLGTSGTVTTLAGIHLKLPRYNRRLIDGVWMESRQVENMIEALLDMSFEQRVENPCIGHDRADLVLAGCAILVAIQRLWPCPRLRVADRGLREGLLTEMMNADNAWQRRSRPFNGKRR